MAPRKQLFLGTFVHSKTLAELEYLDGAAVCVNESGTIIAVERDCDAAKAINTLLPSLGWREDEVDIVSTAKGQFFFPGFIDTHVHASQYPNIGLFGKSTLLDWLKKYTFPLEASLKDPDKARRVYTRVIRKTLSHGTTCAAYYATIDADSTNLLTGLCFSAGQRALVGRVCMDFDSPDYYRDANAEAAVAATRKTIDHVRKVDPSMSLVRPIITPRFAPACSLMLRELGHLAHDTGLPVQTHISENLDEVDRVRKLFPPSETGASDDSYAALYDAVGLLTPRTILAHAIHLSDNEAKLIAKRGAKVSHCPCSNSALTSGAARVRWLLDHGIVCGLGTDMSAGFSPSILTAARHAALVSRHVAMQFDPVGEDEEKKRERERAKLSVDEVLYLATRGGAEVVGLKDKVGAFEEGMEWDAQLVGLGTVGEDGQPHGDDGGDVDLFGSETETLEESVAKWLYNGDDRNTKKVWVKGRLVHERK